MVRGIESRKKAYIEVITRTDKCGTVTPLKVVWEDGRHFKIDRIIERRPAASLKVGGRGLRYLVVVSGVKTYLYFEDPKWFVEEKCCANNSVLA